MEDMKAEGGKAYRRGKNGKVKAERGKDMEDTDR